MVGSVGAKEEVSPCLAGSGDQNVINCKKCSF